MTDTPSYAANLSLVDERSTALREAVAAASDLDARVPGCPDWSLRDLVSHLGQVQRFWSVVVRAGQADGPPPSELIADPEPRGDLLEWSAESTMMLLAALTEAGPDAPCWTWWPGSGAPQTSGAVARHQVEEAAVHAYDAQETIGKPEPVPAAVAVDGVAEFLQVTYGSEGAWPHRPARVAFASTEGPSWTLDLTPAGARLDPAGVGVDAAGAGGGPAGGGGPVATVHGSASDILLVLFGREPLETLRIDGDRTLVEQLRAWGDTQ
jgi:uncharacterized protein (TIGR03083 family)